MKTRTTYEWCIETMDEHGDIIDSEFYQSLDEITDDFEWSQLCLVKDVYHNIQGLQNREHAYIVNHELPDFFDDGTKVPSRYHVEFYKRFNSI